MVARGLVAVLGLSGACFPGVRIVFGTSASAQQGVRWYALTAGRRYRDRNGLRTVTLMKRGGFVADAMITDPKTHDIDTAADEIRAFFADDHVHMALIVGSDRRLVTAIERPDLPASSSGSSPARELGTLTGRTVSPSAALDAVTGSLLRDRRRRLAVVDDRGRLVGLLCLKSSGTGYCSDDDVHERRVQNQPAAR